MIIKVVVGTSVIQFTFRFEIKIAIILVEVVSVT